MRLDRFKQYLEDLLAEHPAVASVEHYPVPGDSSLTDLKVNFEDGTSMELRIVRSSPPGGDDHKAEEKIVIKSST